MTEFFMEIAKDQGAGLVALVLVLALFYKLAIKFGGPFIEAQRAQTEAMIEQTSCMRDMKETVTEFVSRDNNDHRELQIGMEVLSREVNDVGQDVKSLEGLIAEMTAGLAAFGEKLDRCEAIISSDPQKITQISKAVKS